MRARSVASSAARAGQFAHDVVEHAGHRAEFVALVVADGLGQVARRARAGRRPRWRCRRRPSRNDVSHASAGAPASATPSATQRDAPDGRPPAAAPRSAAARGGRSRPAGGPGPHGDVQHVGVERVAVAARRCRCPSAVASHHLRARRVVLEAGQVGPRPPSSRRRPCRRRAMNVTRAGSVLPRRSASASRSPPSMSRSCAARTSATRLRFGDQRLLDAAVGLLGQRQGDEGGRRARAARRRRRRWRGRSCRGSRGAS